MGPPGELRIVEALVPRGCVARELERRTRVADRQPCPAEGDLVAERGSEEGHALVALDDLELAGEVVHAYPGLIVDRVPGDDRVPLLERFPVALLEDLELRFSPAWPSARNERAQTRSKSA